MKRLFSAVLAVALMVSLAGCSANNLGSIDKLGDMIEMEDKLSNIFGGNSSDCQSDHYPHAYDSDSNVIKCECGDRYYYSADLPDLNYNTFSNYVSKKDTFLKDRNEYCAESFLRFRGVNPFFFDLLEEVDDEEDVVSNYEQVAKRLDQLSNVLKTCQLGEQVYVNFFGDADAVTKAAQFDQTLGNSITILQGLVHYHKMLDAGDPFEACDEFIDTIKEPLGMISGVTGGANTFLLVGLDSLKIVLDAFRVGAKAHLKILEFTRVAALPGNGSLITWENIGKDQAYWKQVVTFEHIMHDPDDPDCEYQKKEGIKLPSLVEIMKDYDGYTEDGKAFADEYIAFCLDVVFEEILGMGFYEYLAYIAE